MKCDSPLQTSNLKQPSIEDMRHGVDLWQPPYLHSDPQSLQADADPRATGAAPRGPCRLSGCFHR